VIANIMLLQILWEIAAAASLPAVSKARSNAKLQHTHCEAQQAHNALRSQRKSMLLQVAAHGTITNRQLRRVSGTIGKGCLGSILGSSITNRLASQENATPTCVLATWSLKAAAVCVRMCVCVGG
jgi:hypothetical protein